MPFVAHVATIAARCCDAVDARVRATATLRASEHIGRRTSSHVAPLLHRPRRRLEHRHYHLQQWPPFERLRRTPTRPSCAARGVDCTSPSIDCCHSPRLPFETSVPEAWASWLVGRLLRARPSSSRSHSYRCPTLGSWARRTLATAASAECHIRLYNILYAETSCRAVGNLT